MNPRDIDNELRRHTIDTLGVADADVLKFFQPATGPLTENVTWFSLSVRRNPRDEWELIGRRRTKAELFVMVDSIKRVA